MKMKLAFLLMISTLFHHGFNTKITMLEKKEIFVSEDDEPNYETENNKARSWEDILIGYDADNCHHPNACDPLPCCAETKTKVYCCPYKDGVCCGGTRCCPKNTVCTSIGCIPQTGSSKTMTVPKRTFPLF